MFLFVCSWPKEAADVIRQLVRREVGHRESAFFGVLRFRDLNMGFTSLHVLSVSGACVVCLVYVRGFVRVSFGFTCVVLQALVCFGFWFSVSS